MKRNFTLFAGALVLISSAGAAQAHGSLFGIFFKHHAHYACGHHHNDHGPQEVYHHLKKRHHGHHKKHYVQHKKHYGHHKKHYGHYVHKEPKFIW